MKPSTMFKSHFLLIITAILWTSCSNRFDNNGETNHSATDTISLVEHDHAQHGDNKSNVSLNHGQKWDADHETITGIKTMKDLVSLQATEMITADCLNLKSSLNTEFSNMLSKCKMEGEAHKQLHNFLVPLQGMIQGLEADTSCKEKIGQLNSYLDEFGNYFD